MSKEEEDVSEIYLFVRPGCSGCEEILKGDVPENITIVNVRNATTLAEAAFYDVVQYPALVYPGTQLIQGDVEKIKEHLAKGA